MGTAKLPDLNSLSMQDYDAVYEPSDDTFLLCDAIESDRDEIVVSKPRISLEIGCGSGCVITFLAQMLRDGNIGCHCMATDLNRSATLVAKKLSTSNNVFVDIVNTDLVAGLESGLSGKVDILIFNPPYVPTPDEEVGSTGIEAAWAGGLDGRVVIDRFLPLLQVLLAPSSPPTETSTEARIGGRCYLVLVEENKPKEIISYARSHGMDAKIVLKRRAVNEGLMILKIWKP